MSAKAVTITLAGADWEVPASYRTSAAMFALGCDPLKMSIAAHKDGMLPIDFEQLVSIIHAGVKQAGCSLPRDEVGEAIISEMGMITALEKASELLTAIVTGGPSEEDANFKPKKPSAARRKTGQS